MTNPDRFALMTIGVLSKRTGCKIETIRYYEQMGLLPAPARSQGGHRHFGEPALKRLTFILRARKLGFPLDTVRALLALSDGQEQSCEEVQRIAAHQLQDVRAKQEDLKVMENVLAEMVSRCADGTTPECPLIEALFEDPASA
ncbi:MAG: helix-turn-helix domain-containing protein [Alphaproteobacteria bacterium]|jgi:MerR family transcriptional regulator, mercuric resistance operon regulatory protein|nr:helix-turn-helix domain-containing protein [Alphaproteobacteria bacterium]MBT7943780.1 helix-turn-helix domain-containing protein [Alphaproteobacteria bacterium]